MKDSTIKLLLDDAFAISFNMNDTFYYACADSSCIDVHELEELEPIIEECGYSTLVAYEALKRGHDPMIPQRGLADPDYVKAKSKIQELRETNTRLQSEIVLLFESTEQEASQKVANTTSMIQQNNQTVKALQEKYDSMQSIIDEYGEEVKGATSKISLFESQVERKDENIDKVKEDIGNQKKLAKSKSVNINE
jgi:hypothetical protein